MCEIPPKRCRIRERKKRRRYIPEKVVKQFREGEHTHSFPGQSRFLSLSRSVGFYHFIFFLVWKFPGNPTPREKGENSRVSRLSIPAKFCAIFFAISFLLCCGGSKKNVTGKLPVITSQIRRAISPRFRDCDARSLYFPYSFKCIKK